MYVYNYYPTPPLLVSAHQLYLCAALQFVFVHLSVPDLHLLHIDQQDFYVVRAVIIIERYISQLLQNYKSNSYRIF